MTENSGFKAKTMSKTDLRNYYGISRHTLLVWLAGVPGLGDVRNKKLFTPAEVQIIVNHLGTQ